MGTVSTESILKAHPLVEDVEKEKEQEKSNLYVGVFQEEDEKNKQGVNKDGKFN